MLLALARDETVRETGGAFAERGGEVAFLVLEGGLGEEGFVAAGRVFEVVAFGDVAEEDHAVLAAVVVGVDAGEVGGHVGVFLEGGGLVCGVRDADGGLI